MAPRLRDVMNDALEWLRAERIEYNQTSEFQIRSVPDNIYPGKGTIFMEP